MSEEKTFAHPSEITEADLVDHYAREVQALADKGVPLEAIGAALVTLGLRFETAAHGPSKVAVRLAVAANSMVSLAEEVATQPPSSTAVN